MKRLISFACIVAALASLMNGFAAGLIVVDSPSGEFSAQRRLVVPGTFPPADSQPPRVIPPGHPISHPPRTYPFAPLHLNSHKAEITIRDQIASVAIEQEFYNPNPQRLEGTFLFPLPRGAQIKKFAMEIAGKSVEAELLSAEKARQIYEDIVRKMRDPALMEYAGRELIRVRIFPIEPHERKRVTLAYTQLLRADSGMVEFTYPLNTEKFSAVPIQSVSLKLDLETGRPLKTIYSSSHSVEIKRHGSNRASLAYEAKNVKPDSDFQLYFTAENRDVAIDLMTYRTGPDEGFFLLFASPGLDAGEKKIIPKDVAFVLDTSGSMAGKKLDQAKKALQFCVENLNDGDRFEVMRFAAEVEPLFNQLVEAGNENRAKATAFIKALKPIGGTAIDDALKRALTLRDERSSRPLVIIFLTDGLPTVGVTNEDQIVAAVNKNSGSTRVFCFGIGHDVNTHLLDRITESTRAASQYVVPEEDIEVKVSNFFTKIKEPVLANLKVMFPESGRVAKLYPNALPDLFKGEQLVLAGRYAGGGAGTVVIEGMAGGTTRKFTQEVKFPDSASEHDFIPRLWATRRVGYLLDEMRLHGDNKELRDEVTELARQFGIVTPYTAYLIVEDEKQRGVPLGAQSLPQLQTDARARELSGAALQDLYQKRSGGGAVAGARSGLALKMAEATVDALKLGNAEANESLAFLAAPNSERGVALNVRPALASPSSAPPAPASDSAVASRVMQHTEQTRFVNGKSFFQNGSHWIDAQAQKMPNAQRVRVQFNSREYYELAATVAEARPWLAIGQNVQFIHKGKLYEVYE